MEHGMLDGPSKMVSSGTDRFVLLVCGEQEERVWWENQVRWTVLNR